MLPLCADGRIGMIVWSPLARRLARDGEAATRRSARCPFADVGRSISA